MKNKIQVPKTKVIKSKNNIAIFVRREEDKTIFSCKKYGKLYEAVYGRYCNINDTLYSFLHYLCNYDTYSFNSQILNFAFTRIETSDGCIFFK